MIVVFFVVFAPISCAIALIALITVRREGKDQYSSQILFTIITQNCFPQMESVLEWSKEQKITIDYEGSLE